MPLASLPVVKLHSSVALHERLVMDVNSSISFCDILLRITLRFTTWWCFARCCAPSIHLLDYFLCLLTGYLPNAIYVVTFKP